MAFFKKYLPIYAMTLCCFLLVSLLTSRAVTTVAQAELAKPGVTIVVDPGHGGEDGGALSCTGVPESRLNLEISLKLRDLLHFMGYSTRMVRETDVSIHSEGAGTIAQKKVSDLRNRVALVNATDNALLISIHQNQFPESKYFGAQVFYAPTEGSRELAEGTQSLLISALNPQSSRRCKSAGEVYLMKNIHCTGILVECGFLSNPMEEARLRDGAFQQKLCCVIVCALDQFLTERQNVI